MCFNFDSCDQPKVESPELAISLRIGKAQNKKMKKNMPNISRRGFASMDPNKQRRIASMPLTPKALLMNSPPKKLAPRAAKEEKLLTPEEGRLPAFKKMPVKIS